MDQVYIQAHDPALRQRKPHVSSPKCSLGASCCVVQTPAVPEGAPWAVYLCESRIALGITVGFHHLSISRKGLQVQEIPELGTASHGLVAPAHGEERPCVPEGAVLDPHSACIPEG